MMGYAFVKVSVLQRFLAKLENNEQRPKAAKLLSRSMEELEAHQPMPVRILAGS